MNWLEEAIKRLDHLHDWCRQLPAGAVTELDGPILKLRRTIHRSTAWEAEDSRLPSECMFCRQPLEGLDRAYGEHRECRLRVQEKQRFV